MNKIISALAAVAVGAALASCSLLNGNGPVIRKDKPASKPTVEAAETAEAKQEQTPAVSDRPVKPATTGSKLAGKLEGEWYILKAGAYDINVEESPYVYFEEANGRFYANDGCNVVNGDFSLEGDNKLEFSNALSTRKACPGVLFAPTVAKALSGNDVYKVDLQDKGQETMMTLKSATGAAVMTLTRHNLAPLNGQWLVRQIGEQKIDDENVNLFLDLADMTTHGNTGCNFFNGSIVIDPRLTNSISFTQMGATMRLCPDSDVEMAMMVALEQASAYRLDGGKLHLLDPAGVTLMTLSRQ